jgi:hypothetical protein
MSAAIQIFEIFKPERAELRETLNGGSRFEAGTRCRGRDRSDRCHQPWGCRPGAISESSPILIAFGQPQNLLNLRASCKIPEHGPGRL